MNRKLILLQKVRGLGKGGDIIEVKKGYARNFLLPKGLAKRISQKDIEKIEEEKEFQRLKLQEELAKIKDIGHKLAKKRILVRKRTTSTGKLYAAVSPEDIAQAIYQTYGFQLPAESIKADPIKALGLHTFKIVLPDHEEVLMKVKLVELWSKKINSKV